MSIITRRQVVHQPDLIIQHDFAVPPGVQDLRTMTNQDILNGALSDDFSGTVEDGVSTTYPDNPDGGGALVAPDLVTLISQNVRNLTAKSRVVDLVFEVSGQSQVAGYSVRFTKA